jgi:hypothetical protein
MNRQEASRIVAVIIAACPAQSGRLDAGRASSMVDTYASLLADLSYEQVNAAVTVLLQTRTWMPSVADIRGTALELARGPVRPGGEAWGSVLRAISEQGVYRTPGDDFVFRDAITARCVSALGWTVLCNSENQAADRARFIELYDRLASQSLREAQSPQLGAAATHQRQLEERTGATTAAGGVRNVINLLDARMRAANHDTGSDS